MEMFYYYDTVYDTLDKNPKLMIRIIITFFIAFIDSLAKNQLFITSVNLYYSI